jgi:hypothetical protein
MEQKIAEIWQHWRPYYKSNDGKQRSYIINQEDKEDLQVEEDNLHLRESASGEIYIQN